MTDDEIGIFLVLESFMRQEYSSPSCISDGSLALLMDACKDVYSRNGCINKRLRN